MPKLRVHNLSVSADGFAAGPNQSLEQPLGVNGESLHEWIFKTPYWQRMIDEPVTFEPGIDEDFLVAGDENIGAHIMGRNMFTHSRGPWSDDGWKGWWGDNPPYHHDVFVLTHYPHDPIPMEGGTTFYFVTEGIEAALERAFEAANGQDVRIGGGASTVRQYLAARLVDELHIPISPTLLGSGEPVLGDLDLVGLGYEVVESATSPSVLHLRIAKKGSATGS